MRCIVNDASKNVASKEIMAMRNEIIYWKRRAGERADDLCDIADVARTPQKGGAVLEELEDYEDEYDEE